MRLRAALQRTGGTTTGFAVPDDVVAGLGGGGRPEVVVTLRARRPAKTMDALRAGRAR